jgi:phosphoribosylcarboxyaminoimidazole (NCAIR) mutase
MGKLYVVCYKRSDDSLVIRSMTAMPKDVAVAWIKIMNKDHPQYAQHWIEEANEQETERMERLRKAQKGSVDPSA